MAIVRDAFEAERMARTMSMVMAVFMLVPVFAPAIGALGLVVAPWQIVFWLPVFVGIGLSVWLVRLPETLPESARRAVILFGLIAVMLAVGSMLSARLVMVVGVFRLIRGASVYLVSVAGLLFIVVLATDGAPSLWVFVVGAGLLLPGVTLLVPNLNTAAMGPVPHVAGMAAALLGTISTGGGALLGSLVDASFDGSVQPFVTGAFIYAIAAVAAIFLLGRPPGHRELAVEEDLLAA
jgi:DHA1 family bicyclomycin/chloramphenicol resistance-like MFS transporter